MFNSCSHLQQERSPSSIARDCFKFISDTFNPKFYLNEIEYAKFKREFISIQKNINSRSQRNKDFFKVKEMIDINLSSKDKLRSILDHLLELELKSYSQQMSLKVKEALNHIHFVATDSDLSDYDLPPGLYEKLAKRKNRATAFLTSENGDHQIVLYFSKEILDSPLAYVILFHEVFHVIQHEAFQDALLKKSKKAINHLERYNHDLEVGYFQEQGAMAAEWKYLRSIPDDLWKEMNRELFENMKEENLKTVFLSYFEPLSPNYREFVKLQRFNDRYSKIEYLNSYGNKFSRYHFHYYMRGAMMLTGLELYLSYKCRDEEFIKNSPNIDTYLCGPFAF